MKMLMTLLIAGMSTAFANDPRIVITSFNYTGPQNAAAELCGQVTNGRVPSPGPIPAPVISTVHVTSDPRSRAVSYTVPVDDRGRFCAVIATQNGEVNIDIGRSATPVSAKIQ